MGTGTFNIKGNPGDTAADVLRRVIQLGRDLDMGVSGAAIYQNYHRLEPDELMDKGPVQVHRTAKRDSRENQKGQEP